mgnify:CR=1 FL=1
MKKLSFVIPCYFSVNTLPSVVDEIKTTMSQEPLYDFEIILVNDCSPDSTWETICKLVSENKNILGINLSKNFGQHAATMAGYRHVQGDIIVTLDDDGQTPADEVMNLVHKLEEGYDVVYASYHRNMESTFRRFGSRINSIMAEYMIGKPRNIAIQSYNVAKRYIIDEVVKYDGAYPYIFGLVFRTTKKIANVEVRHRSREVGQSGYTFSKLLGLWMNGFTAFSVKPLRIATLIGTISAFLGFMLGIFFIAQKIVDPSVPIGYSSIITSITFFSGLIMLTMGLLGEYIGRIYISLNKSPQYVIKDTLRSEN